ncbi:MAG: hypothetical protein R2784_17960 [Saprospiraceae bacterium]
MKFKIICYFLLMNFSLSAQVKTTEKIFYDENWKVTNKSNAYYYRIIDIGKNGKPIGTVKDYYITGELQWEGYLSHVDRYDNAKDIIEGRCIWYYKNGKKSRESNMVNNLQNGKTTYWHENGKKAREVDYVMGVLNRVWVDYYENGRLYRRFNFSSGKLDNKFLLNVTSLKDVKRFFLAFHPMRTQII